MEDWNLYYPWLDWLTVWVPIVFPIVRRIDKKQTGRP